MQHIQNQHVSILYNDGESYGKAKRIGKLYLLEHGIHAVLLAYKK